MCANAQAYLNHRWAHMSEGTYSDVEPRLQHFFVLFYYIKTTPSFRTDRHVQTVNTQSRHRGIWCPIGVCNVWQFNSGQMGLLKFTTSMVRREWLKIQSTLVISNSKGLWNTSRYPYFDISDLGNRGKKIIDQLPVTGWICNLTPVRDILKILWKRGEIAPKEQFLLFSTIFYCMLVDLCVKTGTRFSLRDQRLFEASEFEKTRVDCIWQINMD